MSTDHHPENKFLDLFAVRHGPSRALFKFLPRAEQRNWSLVNREFHQAFSPTLNSDTFVLSKLSEEDFENFIALNLAREEKALESKEERYKKYTKVKCLSLPGYTKNDQLELFLKFFPNLEKLILSWCSRLTDADLVHLHGMPLHSLTLCQWLTDAGLVHLRGMPLQSLDLIECKEITGAGFVHLRGMRLQSLNLSRCRSLRDAGLQHLRDLPLQELNLSGCSRLTDAGLQNLRDLPLGMLDLEGCEEITGVGFVHLRGMPLRILRLRECHDLTDAGLVHLRGLPLRMLDLKRCSRLTDAGLQNLRDLPLSVLDLEGCSRLTEEGLVGLLENLSPRCLVIKPNGEYTVGTKVERTFSENVRSSASEPKGCCVIS